MYGLLRQSRKIGSQVEMVCHRHIMSREGVKDPLIKAVSIRNTSNVTVPEIETTVDCHSTNYGLHLSNKEEETSMKTDESLQNPDYFQVHNLFTVKDLFQARVHLGHKIGSMHPNMRDYIFGSRFDSLIIDLDRTAFHIRQALNFTAHIAYRKGIIVFVSRSPQTMYLVEKTAIDCGEYVHSREWESAVLTNSTRKFGGITRLPDVIIMLNTLDTVLAQHGAVTDASKMLIPTIGIVDTNCDPNLITYPIPGNDDTFCALELYCKLFKEAILRGKSKRKLVNNLSHFTAELRKVEKC